MHTLSVILASTRPGRVGPEIAAWFVEQAKAHGRFDVDLIDLAEVGLPLLDEPEHPSLGRYRHPHTREWSSTVASTDAFVFVTPEYNYAVPATLKNALDYLFHEWAYKPVGFVSYGMSSAGLNAVAMLRQVVTPLKMVPVMPGVAIPLRERVGADGVLDPVDWMSDTAETMLDELDRLSGALRPLRRSDDAARVGA